MGSQSEAFRKSLGEEKLEATDSGRVPGEQSLRQKGKRQRWAQQRHTSSHLHPGCIQGEMGVIVRSLEMGGRIWFACPEA